MENTTQVRPNSSTKSTKPQAKVKAPAEFKIVRLRECPVQNAVVDNPPALEKFWREHVEPAPYFDRERESLWVFCLNIRRRLIGFQQLSQGTKDTVLVNYQDVFRLATLHNAGLIILAHNHPSGDPTPSDADVEMTQRLITSSRFLKIELLDHIIIGAAGNDLSYVSLLALGHFDSKIGVPKSEPKTKKEIITGAAEELNQAAIQSNVLLELIENHLDHREHRGGENFTGKRADDFNFGLALLAQHTRERLKKAADAVMEAAYQKTTATT